MEGMTTLDLATAHELVRLMAKRERLLRRLAEYEEKLPKCEEKLRRAMGRWASEVTGVHEGDAFVFRGAPAVLTEWMYWDLPVDLTEVPGCISAYIKTDPGTTEGPRYFTSRELMVSDFLAEDPGHEED